MAIIPGDTIDRGLQYDQYGRPFYNTDSGGRSYVSPTAMMPGAARTTAAAPQGQQWNQNSGAWEANRTILERAAPYIAGGLLTGGTLSALGAFSGGAGAASAGGAASSAGPNLGTLATGSVVRGAAIPAFSAAGSSSGGFPWGSVLGTSFGIGGQLIGAKLASDASERSADLYAQSQREALAFQREQAAQQREDFITAQNASYDQWAARENRLAPYRASGQGATQTLAGLLGLPAVHIPPPGPRPNFGGASSGEAISSSAPGGTAFTQADFQKMTAGLSPTPKSLESLAPQLAKYGIKVHRNAAGVAGKIEYPNGYIRDVIQAAGEGGKAWQW